MSTRDIMMISCGCLVIFMHVSWVLWTVGIGGLLHLFRSSANRCLTIVNPWKQARESSHSDLKRERVQVCMRQRQEKRFQAWCSSSAHVCAIVVATVLINVVAGSPRWMTQEQDAVIILALLLFVVANLYRKLRAEARYTLFGTIMLFFISWVALAGSTPEEVMLSILSSWLLRLTGSVAILDARTSTCWNVACSLANTHKYLQVEFNATSLVTARTFIYFDVATAMMTAVFAAGFQSAVLAEVQREVEAVASKIEQSAVMLLLDMVCDVVLSLDSDLKIVDHSPRFAAMMMLDANRSLVGVELQSFMCSEEDKIRFQSQLSSTHFDMECASRSLNVNIRESNGASFVVEILSVPFQGLDNSTNYMVGIREVTETQPSTLKPLSESHWKEVVSTPSAQRNSASWVRQGTPPTIEGSSLLPQQDFAANGSTKDATLKQKPTEPSQSDETVGDDESSMGSVSSTGSSGGGFKCAVSGHKPTSDRSKHLTLGSMMSTWNVLAPRRSCCTLHATLNEVKSVVRAFSKAPCVKNFHSSDSVSCKACGILNCFDEEGICTVCGHDRDSTVVVSL